MFGYFQVGCFNMPSTYNQLPFSSIETSFYSLASSFLQTANIGILLPGWHIIISWRIEMEHISLSNWPFSHMVKLWDWQNALNYNHLMCLDIAYHTFLVPSYSVHYINLFGMNRDLTNLYSRHLPIVNAKQNCRYLNSMHNWIKIGKRRPKLSHDRIPKVFNLLHIKTD